VRAKKWDIVNVYEDNSVSAYSGTSREAYDRMVSDYKKGMFDVIVAWKLDRLTRSVRGFAEMLDEVQGQGLRICTGDLGDIDLSSADARFTTNILVNVAEFESARKSERMKRANLQRARKGTMRPGSRCFGYGNHFEVIQDEAECVRRIYESYVSGASMSSIARSIAGDENDTLGLPRFEAPSIRFARERYESMSQAQRERLSAKQVAALPHDVIRSIPEEFLSRFTEEEREVIDNALARPQKGFDLAVVQTILNNPRYAGYVCYVPTVNGKTQTPNSHWTDYIVRDLETNEPVQAAWPAIVDRDTWWQAQRRREKNKYRSDGKRVDRNGGSKKHVGSGFYRCGVCGAPVKAGDGTYKCIGHVSRERPLVDRYVIGCARARLAMPDAVDMLLKATETADTSVVDKEISEQRGRLEQARSDYKKRYIDGPLYSEIKEEVEQRLADLEKQRAALIPETSGIKALLNAGTPVQAFDQMRDAGQISEVLDALMEVTLLKHKPGKRYTPESLVSDVAIKWKYLPSPDRFIVPDDPAEGFTLAWPIAQDPRTPVQAVERPQSEAERMLVAHITRKQDKKREDVVDRAIRLKMSFVNLLREAAEAEARGDEERITSLLKPHIKDGK